MDLIREMAMVIEQDRPKSFNLLIPKGSKLKRLYSLAAQEEFRGDAHAAKAIYNSDASDKRFIMLKGNLINKLSELTLTANHSDINKRNFIKVQFQCERNLSIAKKLLFVNVYHNAERIAKKVLKRAEKFYLSEIELECYYLLRKIYYLKGYPVDVERYQKLALAKQNETKLMDQSYGLVQISLAHVKFVRSQSNSLQVLLKTYSLEIKTFKHECQSPFLVLSLLRVKLIRAHQANNLNKWNKALEKLWQHLMDYPFLETEHLLLEVNISAAKYYIATQEFQLAHAALNELLEFTSYEAFNRFEVLAELFQLHIHRQNYDEALSLLIEVFEETRFEELDKLDRAGWMIRSAYLSYLFAVKGERKSVPGFSLDELQQFFFNCSPISKDKVGFNLQFLIIRALQLKRKGILDSANESNNLKVYYQRYIKDEKLKRTKGFVRGFIKILRSNFDEEVIHQSLKEFADEHGLDHICYDYCEIVDYRYLISTL
tara:strand:+ start:2454 stop:3914 length:1461 start_codon:yes stop_codon:yes gene_type:complete